MLRQTVKMDLSLRCRRNLAGEKMIIEKQISNPANDIMNENKSNENMVIGLGSNVREVSFNCYLHLNFTFNYLSTVNYSFTALFNNFSYNYHIILKNAYDSNTRNSWNLK